MIKRLWKWLTEKEYRIVGIADFYEVESRMKIFPFWFPVFGTLSGDPRRAAEDLKSLLQREKYKQYLGSKDAIMRNKDE